MYIAFVAIINYTIKKFNKGLKLLCIGVNNIFYYTIKKFNKGLKQKIIQYNKLIYYTIKKFNKGLKPIFCHNYDF